MARFQVEFHPESIRETREAIRWYRERDEDVAVEFRLLVKSAEDLVVRFPESWAPYLHGTRGFRFHKFPFVLVYILRDNRIIFVALAHTKRKTGYWKSRLP